MTVRTRLAGLAPVWRYAVNRSREAARLAATVRQLEHDLAVTRADRDALKSHYELAVAQRDGARELIAAVAAADDWSEGDRAQLDEWGVAG